MEPTNHPFRQENDLNPTSMIMFHVNLPGCSKSLVNPMKNAMEFGHLGRRIARLRGRKLAMVINQ